MKKIPTHIYTITALSIIVVIFLFVIIKKSTKGGREDEAKKKLSDEAKDVGLDMDNVIADVDQIRVSLGIDIIFGLDWAWEDEDSVVDIVLGYNRNSFPILEDTYNRILGRSIISDFNKYLDDDDIQEIAHIIL